MSQNGVVRFPGNLDPSAQEFRPTFPAQHHHFPYFSPPPTFLYSPQQPPPSYVTPSPSPSPSPTFLPPSIPPPASSPTRALLLTAVPPDVSESLVRRELEIFGDVRAVQMRRVSEGILTVHFYDLRAAHAALDAVREQHMQHQNRLRIHYSSILAPNTSFGPPLGLEALAGPPPPPPPAPGLIAGRPVWAQFTIPASHAFPDGQNQGTLVIFNLNPNVSTLTLNDIFQPFGAVKELRETPMKRQQRFIEFYDVRDASRALTEMNGKEINGRTVMIEFSRPGGHSNKKFNHHHNHHFNNNTNPNFHPHNSKPPPQQQPPPPLSLRQRKQTIRRRRSSPSSEESLDAMLGGLSLQVPGIRNEGKKLSGKKNHNDNGNGNGNCSSSGSSSCSSTKPQTKIKPWRGKQKNFDPRFLIKEDDATTTVEGSGSCKDTRTTVMIKNIPNKYSNKCNVGYGFVNMTSPEATLRLYKSFHHQHWEVFNSRKICEVTYARVQGLEALKDHFKNSKFACENDEYLPVVFTPPRDGLHLTAPLPIVLSNTPTDVKASELTSTSTPTTTSTSIPICATSIDGGDPINNLNPSNTILECDDDGSSTNNSGSSNGGGDVVNDDDGGSSSSSMGGSVGD
ncbi:Protein terminal ear1 [Bienertia sinuspersici]